MSLVFFYTPCFQGVQKEITVMKWAKRVFNNKHIQGYLGLGDHWK